MNLYLLRHGETNWNLKRRIQGQTDIPLNNEGILQARKCRSYFDNLRIDAVYASMLDRALSTALLATGRIPCVIREFAERHFGIWQGRLSTDLQEQIPNYSVYFRNATQRAPGGESLQDVIRRVGPIVSSIIADAAPDAGIVICSHGGTSKAIIGTLLDMPLPMIPTLRTIANGGVIVLSRDGEQWQIPENVTHEIGTFRSAPLMG
jgi:broad specificity phosphatase PhoE